MCFNSKQTKSPISLKCSCTERSEYDIKRKDAERTRCVWYTHQKKLQWAQPGGPNYDKEPPCSSICQPIKLSDDYHARDRHAGIYTLLTPTDSYPSFSSQHWKLSSRPPTTPTHTHTVACLSSHLSSIFQGALLSPGKSLLNFKYISRFRFLEMPLHGPTALAASGATSQWWNSHSTGGQTNRTPHTCGDTFCRLVTWQCFICICVCI